MKHEIIELNVMMFLMKMINITHNVPTWWSDPHILLSTEDINYRMLLTIIIMHLMLSTEDDNRLWYCLKLFNLLQSFYVTC
jgi:hypothetical protein